MRVAPDHSRADKGQHVQKARQLLTAVPHTPNDTDESVAELIEQGWVFRVGDAMLYLVPDEAKRHVEIVWWLPLASWLGVEGMGVLIEGCEAVLSEYRGARGWTMGGTFDAPGDTPEEMLQNSESIANIHKQWLPGVRITRAEGTNLFRAESTIAHILAAARAWRGA